MRDPWGLNERMFGFYYPILMGLSERAGHSETRRELLADARGRTCEIGAGSGYNLPHYTDAVSELIVTEPSPHMRRHLRGKLAASPPPVGAWELTEAGAENLPFPDESFDTVVGTYVHCTVPSPVRALAEIHRVLRPGGRYLFIEHVRGADGSLIGAVQDALEVPHRYFAAGCYPNRRTERILRDSPLTVERLEHSTLPLGLLTVRPIIIGSASRD
ncbi:class I SAM-dependent methyltransferase [Amycolatopsis sp. NPDC059027]|uniref:class I SAM-dependent methyltransferase n=1 Tax=unclassified Amycolatopsis TaxID=2618356 RepID=UPI00366D1F50